MNDLAARYAGNFNNLKGLPTTMSQFTFQVFEMKVSTTQEWLRRWAKRYEKITGYDPEYNDLIKKHESFTAEDFRRIGKWKDGVTTEGRWRPNVASVAYIVWEQATKELPKCPDESRVEVFLKGWSNREYEDIFKKLSGITIPLTPDDSLFYNGQKVYPVGVPVNSSASPN